LIYLNDDLMRCRMLAENAGDRGTRAIGRSMARINLSDELLRTAREAAGRAQVRGAIRDLTCHALKRCPLTMENVAVVAQAVGEGIESAPRLRTELERASRHEAWVGLEDAIGRALEALEIAAREFSAGKARMADADRERLLRSACELERQLLARWASCDQVPPSIADRTGSLKELLCAARAGSAPSGLQGEELLSRLAQEAFLRLQG
jgi:hypothetical protein